VIVYGQKELPKRIILKGDSGIFFTKKQEVRLLEKLSQLESCKSESDSLKKDNKYLKSQIEQADYDYNLLSQRYFQLIDTLEVNQLKNEVTTIHQSESIKKWKKSTLCASVAVVGLALGGITGAWLPALAVLTVTEAAIVFTKKNK
jgi:hypothetical protein